MQRRLSALLLTAAVLLAWAGSTLAAPPTQFTSITFPPLSAKGNMDFWKIPWKAGEKIEGSFEVKVAARVRGLTVRAVTNAVSLDTTSRRVIPKQQVRFSQPDGASGDQAAGGTAKVLEPGNYLFTFSAENIPGEDTYLMEIEAVGEVQDPQTGQFTPFVQKLPSIKLKAFAEPEVRIITGSQLTAQWVNQGTPWALLRPIAGLLPNDKETFWNQDNPPLAVAVVMPGRTHVETSQSYDMEVILDPLLDDQGNEVDEVHFVLADLADPSAAPLQTDPETGLRNRTMAVPGNHTLVVSLSRAHTVRADGTVAAPRIEPGIYKTTLHIHTEWGTKYELPVQIRVKDGPFYAVIALITGILVSLLAAYWQTRQPLYRAQMKARRWQRYYDEQGVLLKLVDRVAQRLNGSIVAADGTGAAQSADLLESLMRDLPAALALEAALTELEGMVPDSAFQFWSLTVSAPNVGSAFEKLKGFCAAHPDAEVQKFGASIQTGLWQGLPKAPPADVTPLRERLGGWLKGLANQIRQSVSRVQFPSFWDVTTMVVMFVLVNGGLIAMQMAQSYAQNETFGAGTDYMSLLLWGFAGDATRATLTDLAAKVMPGKGGGTTTPPTPSA